MKSLNVLWVALVFIMVFAPAALAMEKGESTTVLNESAGVFSVLFKIVVKWIFPAVAFYCALYGVLGRGVKRGEWDMAALCVIAAVALALLPRLLASIFDNKAILG